MRKHFSSSLFLELSSHSIIAARCKKIILPRRLCQVVYFVRYSYLLANTAPRYWTFHSSNIPEFLSLTRFNLDYNVSSFSQSFRLFFRPLIQSQNCSIFIRPNLGSVISCVLNLILQIWKPFLNSSLTLKKKNILQICSL